MGKLNEGFSLLSVLIAAVVIATGSIATMALVVRADRVARLGQERFVAVQLAREGLELIRALRDRNWLARAIDVSQSWVVGICDSGGDTSFQGVRQVIFDPQQARAQQEPFEVAPGNPGVGQLYIQPTRGFYAGEWTHDAPLGATPSGYRRVLVIDCQRQGDGVVTITSVVSWKNRLREQRVMVKEELYDWFPTS